MGGAFNPCVYVKGVRKFVLNLSTDSKNHGRLLIASMDGVGQNAQQVIDRQEKCTGRGEEERERI